MPFIGNQPALSYTSFAKQDFTTSATTSYTLDNPVANANELALFINFVRQEPTTAYTASGTSLTLTSATSATDDMYCVFLGKAVQTVNPPSGSVGTAQISSSAKSTNLLYPAFMAYQSAGSVTISSNTVTKVQFDTEVFDTDNTFDNSTNYRFTPGVTGKYFLSAQVICVAGTDNLTEAEFFIQKNGSNRTKSTFNFTNNRATTASPIISVTDEVSSITDYYEVFVSINDSSGSPLYAGDGTSFRTYFTGYRIGA